MSFPHHNCTLRVKDSSGLPRLAPNSSRAARCCRSVRKLFLMNSHHEKCKKLFRNNAAIIAEKKRHASGPHFFVIHPLSTVHSIQEILFFLVWMLALALEPYEIFSSSDWQEFHTAMSYMKLMLILMFFNSGYVDSATKTIVIESRKIVCRYLRTYFFFDILTVTYMFHSVSVLFSNNEPVRELYHACVYAARIMANCVRISTLMDFLNESLANLGCRKAVRSVVVHATRTYICVHLWTFALYFVPKTYHMYTKDRHSTNSWIMQFAKRQFLFGTPTSGIFRYVECFLMAFCYFFGITYIYEIQVSVEQVCFAMLTLFGRIYSLFLLADILNLFGIVGVSQGMYENRMALLSQYLTDMELPGNIKRRILHFCEFKFQGRYFRENRILNTLSEHLRTEIFLFSAKKVFRKVLVFKKLPPHTLGAMLVTMRSENYASKDVIMKIGSDAEDLHFISTGTVAVMNSKNVELCHLEDGDVYGTSCLFIATQIYGVVAVETTEVFIINKNVFLSFISPHPEVMRGFLREAKSRLDELKVLDDNYYTGSFDVVTELQRGKILEKFSKRILTV